MVDGPAVAAILALSHQTAPSPPSPPVPAYGCWEDSAYVAVPLSCTAHRSAQSIPWTVSRHTGQQRMASSSAPPPDISSCRIWTPGREAALAGIRQLVADVEGED